MNKYIITFFLMIQNLFSIGVAAGTEIKNVAYLDYVVDIVSFQAKSNELIDIVDQKIDMQMVCQESQSVVVGIGEKKRAMSFLFSNTGNGEDTYSFSSIEGESVDFSVTNIAVYLDNGDGVFSDEDNIAVDVEVASDENVTLFLVSDIPENADKFSSNGIKASSNIQGSLVYGESKLLEDFYAVVATKEDAKSDVCAYEVSHLAVELEKTATLSSDKVYSGTTISYKIAVKIIGEGSVENIVINDSIPSGTTYIEDSLKLDGITAGDFNGTAISVALASVTQTTASSDPKHHVTFDVRVQ